MFQRRGGIDICEHAGCGIKFFMAETTRDADHLHHILNPLLAQRIAMHNLVRQRQHIIGAVQMTHRRVQIKRFNRIASNCVNTVIGLRQAG